MLHLSAYFVVCLISVWVWNTSAFVPRVATSLRSYFQHRCDQPTLNCTIVDLTIPSISLRSLVESLESDTFEKNVHKKLRAKQVDYVVVLNMTDKASDLQSAYHDVDRFLAERPWWIIHQYPREYVHGILGTDTLQQLILERVPFAVEVGCRALVRAHFPSAEECAKRPLYLKTSVGSWGNDIIVNQRVYFERYPSTIHMLYVTNTGNAGDQVGYIEKHHCPNLVDKHQCAFLSVSNCSLPAELLDCHESKCIREGLYMFNPSSNVQPDHRTFLSQDESLMKVNFQSAYPTLPRAFPDAPSRRMIDEHKPLTAANTEDLRRLDQIRNPYSLLWMFNLLYRPNYQLGLQMQDLLAEFYSPHAGTHDYSVHSEHVGDRPAHFYRELAPETQCTALHIRMGDRHLNNTDMVQWCDEHTNAGKQGDERAKGKWVDGSDLGMGRWHDMGCSWRLPFGALTLAHYVEAALILQPGVNDLFVMTDDYHWLHRAMIEYRKSPLFRANVRLHVFPTHIKNVHKSRMSLQATAEWWASIEAARKCGGFVGHMGSAATYAVYWALCFRHSDQYWRCPPFYYFD